MKIILFSTILTFIVVKAKKIIESPIQITHSSFIRPIHGVEEMTKFADLRTEQFMRLSKRSSFNRGKESRVSTESRLKLLKHSSNDENDDSELESTPQQDLPVNTFINVNPALKSGVEALQDLKKRFKKWYKAKPRIEIHEISVLKKGPTMPFFLELMKDPKIASEKRDFKKLLFPSKDKDSELIVYTDEHPTREVAKVLYKWLGGLFFDEALDSFSAFRKVAPNSTASYLVAMEEDAAKEKRRVIHKTNNVTAIHLERGFRSFGWKFPSDDFDEVTEYLIEKFDSDDSGELEFSEFTYLLFKTTSNFFYSLRCKHCMAATREEVMHFFDFADKDGNNLVTPEELMEALNSFEGVDLKYDYIFYFYSKAERCEYRIELTVEEMCIAFFQAVWEMGLQENKVKGILAVLNDPNAKLDTGGCPAKPKKRVPVKPCKEDKSKGKSKASQAKEKEAKNNEAKAVKTKEELPNPEPVDLDCPDGDCGKSREYIRGISIDEFNEKAAREQEEKQIPKSFSTKEIFEDLKKAPESKDKAKAVET